ncbi:hypothetical protein [Dyadobacter sp. CY261]|uniref:hypothetical protein n=1 Tax=Dyadobacter sp. CY261 TaxID=2907203 RepID=UPI001F441950|nr:hypothetical protein [Dyadobacter sp. CY261]
MIALICLFLSPVANAQDKIIQKDGKEIKAKVLGTDSNYIRYKRSDNPNGPDYFLFRSDVLKIEYENGNVEPKKETNKVVPEPTVASDLQILESKASQYKKRGTILLGVGTLAIVAGAATLIKLNGDYSTYKSQIQKTNDDYTKWYQVNYVTSPPEGDLQKQESFAGFASPGIYAGAAAVIGGIALDLIGLKNVQLAKKARTEWARKKKELSFQPYYESLGNAAGLRIALSF